MELIKTIGDYNIWLSEGNGYNFNSKQFYKGTFIITLFSVFAVICAEYGGRDYSIFYGLVVWASCMLLSLILMVYDDIIPSYIVWSNSPNTPTIYVKKENSETDQIEVCKAAKKIELIISDKIEKNKNLKMIADLCR